MRISDCSAYLCTGATEPRRPRDAFRETLATERRRAIAVAAAVVAVAVAAATGGRSSVGYFASASASESRVALACDGGAGADTTLVNSKGNSLLDHKVERKVESVLPSLQPGKQIAVAVDFSWK